MLDIMKRGTVEANNTTWEFHQDHDQQNIIYITPVPRFAVADGLPKIQVVTYKTSDSSNGSGYCQLVVELGVPDDVIPPITAAVKQTFGVSDPIFQTLAVQAGSTVNITFPDGTGGTTGQQVAGTDFGSNVAVFQLPLTADQIKLVTATLAKSGGSPFLIEYVLSVPSFMPGVTADLSFDAEIAFNYQVTSHAHTKWAHSTTYTYDISKTLTQSNAAKVDITKVDPNISDDVVNAVRTWAFDVIGQRVAAEVKDALALRDNASGTQSFSVSEVSSFTESYAQNETIMWRIRPQATLPSFADLGLTEQQQQSLEVTVDKRQFSLSILPNVRFVDDAKRSSPLKPSNDPFTDVEPVTRLDVTVTYPTLTQSETRTFSFTDNTAHTWTADWDDTAGGKSSIDYVATYKNGQQVKDSIDIDATSYTLGLADIGTLNVTFDASSFFANLGAGQQGATPQQKSSGKVDVQSVDIDLVFQVPNEPPFLQTFTLTDKATNKTISSPFKTPVSSTYYYTITYNFRPDVKANAFTTDVKQSTGSFVRLVGPVVEQSIPVLALMGGSDPSFIELDIKVYYEEQPYMPDITAAKQIPQPTETSPIALSLQPGTTDLQREVFSIFSNSNSAPLILNGSGITPDGGQLQWGPVAFSPMSAANLVFSKAHTFTFVEFDPAIVDWQFDTNGKPALTEIVLQVSSVGVTVPSSSGAQTTGQVSTANQTIAWSPGVKRAPKAFFMVTNVDPSYTGLTVSWTAQYVYTSGSKTASGKESNTTIVLPKDASMAPTPLRS